MSFKNKCEGYNIYYLYTVCFYLLLEVVFLSSVVASYELKYKDYVQLKSDAAASGKLSLPLVGQRDDQSHGNICQLNDSWNFVLLSLKCCREHFHAILPHPIL